MRRLVAILIVLTTLMSFLAQSIDSQLLEAQQSNELNLKLVDYGLTSTHAVKGLRYVRTYLTLLNRGNATILSIATTFTILEGGVFENASRRCFVETVGSYGEGSFINIVSCPMLIDENATKIVVKVESEILYRTGLESRWGSLSWILSIELREPWIDLEVLKSWWSSSHAYPGSEDLTLFVVLQNLDTVDVIDAVAELYLPSSFYPTKLVVDGIGIARGSRAVVSFRGISIDPYAVPGTYLAKLVVDGLARGRDGSIHRFVETFVLNLSIEPRFGNVVALRDVYFSNRGIAYARGSGMDLRIVLQVVKPSTTVRYLRAYVCLPSNASFIDGEPCRNVSLSGVYGYGEPIVLDLGTVRTWFSTETLATIIIDLEYLASVRGAEAWCRQILTTRVEIVKPRLKIELVDYGWSGGYASNRSYGASLYVTFLSMSSDVIENIVAELKPLSGAVVRGRSSATVSTSLGAGYGSSFTLVFRGIDVVSDRSSFELSITATLSCGTGCRYVATYETVLELDACSNVTDIVLGRVETRYGGTPAPLLPTAWGATVSIHIINLGPEPVTFMNVSASPRFDAVVRSVGGTCIGGVGSGSSCSIDVVMDLGNVSPGIHILELSIVYGKRVGDATVVSRKVFEIPLLVEDPGKFVPRIEPLTWFWGVEEPVPAYPRQRKASLSVELINVGRYGVEGVELELNPLNASIEMIEGRALCSARLAPNAVCRATLWLDLSKVEKPGIATFDLVVRYRFTNFGTFVEVSKRFRITLPISSYAGGEGLEIVSSSWLNGWDAYPNTTNATLVVTVANRWPYPVEGMEAVLELPKGFSCSGPYGCRTYVSGPIATLSIAELAFRINVKNVDPGTYDARLVLSYVLSSGGSKTRIVEVKNVSIVVTDPRNLVDVVYASWLGTVPYTGFRGAKLMIVVRNRGFPTMRGPVLELHLPPELRFAVDNSSTARVPPYIAAQNIEQILQYVGKGMPIASSSTMLPPNVVEVGRGQFVAFVVPLNVFGTPRSRDLRASLSFVDQWNNLRMIELRIELPTVGNAKMIQIEAPKEIEFVNGVAKVPIRITCIEGPVYNLYVALQPTTYVAFPRQAVIYVPEIEPNQSVVKIIEFVYNPMHVVGGTAISPSALNLIVTLVYFDAAGNRYVVNQSVSMVVKPFVWVQISTVRAYQRGSELSVVGTVTNLGLETARSLTITLLVNGKPVATYVVGDLDSGTETTFKLSAVVSERIEKATIVASFLDEYGRRINVSRSVVVEQQSVETTPTPRFEGFDWCSYAIPILAVSTFLAVVGYAIWRYLRRHREVFGESS